MNKHMLSFFHIITTTSTISTPPQNIYLVVALNFRSDYRLRTHQWTERGNFDFSDPLVAFINVTIDHYMYSSLY